MADGWRGKDNSNSPWGNAPTVFPVDSGIPVQPKAENGGGNFGGAGRPSLYKPEYDAIARKMCELGATDYELAEAFDCSRSTLYYWMNSYPSFNEACVLGKEAADNRVERGLYHRAVGYSHEAVKIFCYEGDIIQAEYTEHVPPETAASRLWLMNRRPDKWREKVELNGKDGGPIAIRITETDAKL